MLCEVYYHMYNLKNVKNTHGVVLLSLKLQASAQSMTDNDSGGLIIEVAEITCDANHKQNVEYRKREPGKENFDFIQTCHFSIICRISGTANLQYFIFFRFLDALLMFSEKSEVISPFFRNKTSVMVAFYLLLAKCRLQNPCMF